MKTVSKPMTAFEVYGLQKAPDTAYDRKPISKSKLKKKNRQTQEKIKKLSETGLLPTIGAEDTKNVVIRGGAVKPVVTEKPKQKKKKKKKSAASNPPTPSNGSPIKKKKKAKITENGSNITDGKESSYFNGVGEHDEESASTSSSGKNINKKKKKANPIPTGVQNGATPKSLAKNKNNVGLPNGKPSAKKAKVDSSDDNKAKKLELKKKIAKVRELVERKMEVPEDKEFPDEDSSEEDELTSIHIPTFDPKEIDAHNVSDSRVLGQECFKAIISPHTEKEFFNHYWEKKPLYIKRKNKNYYGDVFSTKSFDEIIHEQVVTYSKNLDVTSYSDGKRETHNPIGQAHGPVVWDYYNNGCSLRMLNPQTFDKKVWRHLSKLQEYFNSFCGANIYLTPPDTQGFAPHWDDIEAFILQLEGAKRWRVYKPRSEDEVLPVESSKNLDQDEIGQPVLDVILEPGDLLYFPRGFIHQGQTADGKHSLHITISTYQKNTWGHYLEKLLPQALQAAMAENVEFRKGLPRRYLDYMGVVHSDIENEERTAFKKKVCDLVMQMMDHAPYDNVVDERGASFIHDCLPPQLEDSDKACSVYQGGEKWCARKNRVIRRVELEPDTKIRLIRGNCLRMVAGDENLRIYHTMENSREYHQEEPKFLEIETEAAPAVETLIHTYPEYIEIEGLPLEDLQEKMVIASGLWERGLLVTAQPLETVE